MNWQTLQHITNLNDIKELAAWPDVWVMRGGSSVRGHTLYGFDIARQRLVWALTDIAPPEGLGWSYKRIPFLAQHGDLAVVATYVGRNRERVWLLALDPRTGDLVWRKPLAWTRCTSSNKRFEAQYIGLVNTGAHLVAMENRAAQGETPFLLWLDPATGETVHECPACVTKERALVANGYLYFSGEGREQSGLYRIPAAPGATVAERLLEGQVSSFAITAGNIYAIYSTTNRQDWTFACLDAHTLATRCSYVWQWDDKGYWPHLLAVDPERPEHVVLRHDTRLWAWNWRTAEILWEYTFPFSTDVQALFHTSRGTLLHADQGVEGLDLVTGARNDVGLSGSRVDGAFVVDDYLFTSKSWDGSRLYTCAAASDSPTVGELTCPETKLRELLPDLLTDPRDELETAFGKATGRGSVDTLAKSVRQITRIDQTHQKVKAYLKALKAGELDRGPLNFTPLAELHRGFFFYADLFGFGPEEQFFPGVLIAGEFGGVEFYVMWDSGQVISLHHDASFSEVASDVWNAVEQRERAFAQQFPAAGSALDIAQLVRFQQAFADVKDTGELSRLDERDYLTRAAAAFGWTLKQLRHRLDTHDLALEFLGLHDEELAVLDEMLG